MQGETGVKLISMSLMKSLDEHGHVQFSYHRVLWPVLPPPQIQLMSSPSPGAICECNSSRKRAELAQRRSLASLALSPTFFKRARRGRAVWPSLRGGSASPWSCSPPPPRASPRAPRLAYLLRPGSLSSRTGSGSRRSKSKQLFRIGRRRTALLLQAAATHLESRPERAITHTKHNGRKNCELG